MFLNNFPDKERFWPQHVAATHIVVVDELCLGEYLYIPFREISLFFILNLNFYLLILEGLLGVLIFFQGWQNFKGNSQNL